MQRARVAIIGGSGYGGGELLRLLASHPFFTAVAATSRRHAGRSVSDVHENLLGVSDLVFSDDAPEALAGEADAVIFALPHGEAATRMRAVCEAAPDLRIVDLSGDFRLADPEAWEAAYGAPHPCPELCGEFVYGLTELTRERVAASRRVANPGCFATGAILALAPLAAAGLLSGPVVLNGVTGSSGSGADPKPTTHHPERDGDFRAYRPLAHQHVPEIVAALSAAGAPGVEPAMVPHSAPLSRGIFTTAYVFPGTPVPPKRLAEIYDAFAEVNAFLRRRPGTPRLAAVRGSNYCDVAVAADDGGRQLVVLTAIDNLVKGMAGQAIQNLNLMFGRPETEGLRQAATHP